MGTPAEEGGGGKIMMARAGAFDDVDAAMMVHPADADLVRMDAIAVETLNVAFEGRAAHAAAAPWEGRNALDAAVLGYMGVAALRQHIRPDERVHGIFIEGGDKPNIVPKRASMEWYVRSPKVATLEPLKERVVAALAGGAAACGCTMTHEFDGRAYFDMLDNGPLVASYVTNAARLGRAVADPARDRTPRRGLHRHGERQLPRALDPPDDQGRAPTAWRSTRRTSPSGRRVPTATGRCSTAPRRWP